MADTSLERVKGRMRTELGRGKAIAIVGWRDVYHDEYTRAIPPDKVVFTNSSAPPAYVNFTFFTTNVNGSIRGKISRGRSVSDVLLDPQQIPSLLREVVGTIVSTTAPTSGASTGATDDVLDALTQPQELSAMDQFVRAFQVEAAKNGGRVGSRTLTKLMKEHETGSVYILTAADWIIPEKAEGKQKVGWYRAGSRMAEHEKKVAVLPDDPLERARFLVKQKPAVDEEIKRLEDLLAKEKTKLALIEKVATVIDSLSALVNK